MKTIRPSIRPLFGIVSLLLALPSLVEAQEGLTLTTNHGTITITRFNIQCCGPLIIPSTINGLPVTAIGSRAFLVDVFPTSVTIPNSVTNIGAGAFADDPDLGSITVDVLNSFYTSADGVLFNKSQTTLVEYPGGKFGGYTIPNTVTTIGALAFMGCASLTNFVIPNTVTWIGNQAFWDCTSLTSIAIPDSVTSIGDAAFLQCTSLTNIAIPDSVTAIGDNAFQDCPSLTSVMIGNGVTNIGEAPFLDCPSLSAITTGTLNSFYTSADGVLFNKSQTTLVEYPGGKFGGYSIPNTVTTIGASAFMGCASLTNVAIPNSVTSIGFDAFNNCTSLTSIAIPNSVTSIGDGAFIQCTRLTSVTIPNSVSSIGPDAFGGCTSLGAITVDVLNSFYTSADGVLFNKSQTTLVEYPGGKFGGYSIPNSVTSIGDYAFESCYSLTSIAIPDSVTSIGDWAFVGCRGLTSVTIPNSVSSIGDYAFAETGLINVRIPNSVTSIGDYAFDSCASLTGVYFQGNAPRADSTAFSDDPATATVYYLPGTTGWGSTFGGISTALWVLPSPVILNHGPSFGAQTNGFGFTISWATNATVVVEASTDLHNPKWSPVQTNALNGGTFYFSEPEWTNYLSRFYRVHSK